MRGPKFERLPSGKWRVRDEDANGNLVTVSSGHVSKVEAEAAYRGGGVVTLASIREKFIIARRSLQLKTQSEDEARFDLYILDDEIASLPLTEANRRGNIKAWLGRLRARGLAYQTIKNAKVVLSQAFEYAADLDLIRENAARSLQLPRSWKASNREEFNVAFPDQQIALLSAVPAEYWPAVAISLGQGFRQGELYHLLNRDLLVDRRQAVIRSGGKHGTTKSGHVRRVSLFGIGLEAARVGKGDPEKLFFPGREGAPRAKGEPRGWKTWTRKAGLGDFRWQDLRHTCATSLVAGWWGKKWDLRDVQALLGHESIKTTERYAHFVSRLTQDAALETGFVNGGHGMDQNRSQHPESNWRPTVYEPVDLASSFTGLAVERYHRRTSDPDTQTRADMLEATRLAFRMGVDPIAKARVHDLIEQMARRPGAA